MWLTKVTCFEIRDCHLTGAICLLKTGCYIITIILEICIRNRGVAIVPINSAGAVVNNEKHAFSVRMLDSISCLKRKFLS